MKNLRRSISWILIAAVLVSSLPQQISASTVSGVTDEAVLEEESAAGRSEAALDEIIPVIPVTEGEAQTEKTDIKVSEEKVLASDTAVYYEDLKIWFDAQSAAVTDADSDITDLNLPETIDGAEVKYISEYAFSSCTDLTEVILPGTVTEIRTGAFLGCTSLMSITIPDSVIAIRDGAFSGCTSLTSVVIPDSVTTVGALKDWYDDNSIGVFSGCTNLSEVSLGSGITSIGTDTFSDCTSLESIDLPDSVEDIGCRAFRRCIALKNVHLSSRLKVLESGLFSGCTALTEIGIPDGVTSINCKAFINCENLSSVTIPDSVTSIGTGYYFVNMDMVIYYCGNAFTGCTNLQYVTLPDSVTNFDEKGSYYPNFESTAILFVKEGSEAEHYAVDHNYRYFYYIDESVLSLNICDPDGNPVTEGYSVVWYEHDSDVPVANDTKLSVYSSQDLYDYEITLSERLLYDYLPPIRQQADFQEAGNQYITEYILTPREKITVSGTVTDENGGAVADAVVIFEQIFEKKYRKSTTVQADASGTYSIQLSDAPTTISCYAAGYARLQGTEVTFDDSAYIVETMRLKQLPESRVKLSMEKVCASLESARAKTETITSCGGLEFSLYNETTGLEITDFEARYPYLYIGESGVAEGDLLRITAEDLAGELAPASASVTYSGTTAATAQLSFDARGSFRISVDRSATGLVFDSAGKFTEKYTGSTVLTSAPLPAGMYSFVLIQSTPALSGVSDLDMLDALGLQEGTDYLLLTVEISDGIISDLGTVSIPDFDASAFCYTVPGATGCTIKQTEAAVGSLFSVRAAYQLDEQYHTASEKVILDLPQELSVITGSLTVDGVKTNYLSEDGRVVIETGKSAAVVRFYVSASDAGQYQVNTYLGLDYEGKSVIQPIGTACFTATELSLNAVTHTGRKSVVISGSALPKSEIQLFDNDVPIAAAVANGAGAWSVRFDLIKPGSYSKHHIYAEMTSVYGVKYRSAMHVMTYDENYCDVKRITMVHDRSLVEFDYLDTAPKSLSYAYNASAPYSFKVELTGDNARDVQVVIHTSDGEIVYVPCAYDGENDCYIASYSGGIVTGVAAAFDQPNEQSVCSVSGISGLGEGEDHTYTPKKKGSVYKEAAENMTYGIVDTYPKEAANGCVTLFLDGRLFEPDISVSLSGGAAAYTAKQVYWVNHQTIYAVFDLTDAPDGTYSVTAESHGQSDTCSNCLTVNSALEKGQSSININISEEIAPNTACGGSITVTNVGCTDIYAPVLKLTGENLKFRFDEDSDYVSEEDVFVRNWEGLAGIIAPGETASIDFTYISEEAGEFTLTADDYSSKDGELYGTVSLNANSDISDILTANMLSLIGTTYPEYTEHMAKMACAVGTSYDGAITPELLEGMYEQNARGELGGSDGFSVIDLSGRELDVQRTFSNSLHRKQISGVFGIGWTNDYEVTAEYLKQDEAESILLTSGNSVQIFVRDADKGGFVDILTGEDVAERNSDGTIVVRLRSGISQTFGSDGQLQAVSDVYGNTVSYDYEDGVITGIETSSGDSLTYSYQNGKISSITSETTGDTVTYTYDGDYLISAATKYGTTKYSYDKSSIGGKRGTLTEIVYPDDTSAAYTYDELGRMVSAADSTGTVCYSYGLNEITAVDEEGNTVREHYDMLGNVLWSIDAYGDVCYYEYDRFTYLTKESFGLFYHTGYQYNEDGELTAVNTADGEMAGYAYDSHGGIASVTDQLGNKVRYDEDENGLLSAIVYPNGESESYTYDEKGNLASAADCNGVTVRYAYNDRNQMIRADYSTGNRISYTYDEKGNLTSINEDGSITAIAYDQDNGSLAQITYPNGKSISYGYDELGRRAFVKDSEGNVTGYGYNENGWLGVVYDGETAAVTYTYNKDGTLAKQQNANGTYAAYTYQNGMLSELCNYGAGGAVNSRFLYTYNEFGYISSIESSDGIWKYEYDLAGQLIQTESPDGTVTQYTYDAAGNRICVAVDDKETDYTVNSMNQYLTVGGITRSYDADGHLLTETSDQGVTSYEWDYRGRLVKVTSEDGHIYEYEYDIFGGRSKVTVDGVSTEYVNDPTGSGYALTAYFGDEVTRYLVSDGIAAMGTEDGLYFYSFNHLGSTVGITAPDGSLANSYVYDSEGNVLAKSETVQNPYTYVGAYGIADDGNGLWYDRARYVSQTTDSFISMDPAAQYYDLNMYRYVGNNAVNYIDVSGEGIERIGQTNPIRPIPNNKLYFNSGNYYQSVYRGAKTSGQDIFIKSTSSDVNLKSVNCLKNWNTIKESVQSFGRTVIDKVKPISIQIWKAARAAGGHLKTSLKSIDLSGLGRKVFKNAGNITKIFSSAGVKIAELLSSPYTLLILSALVGVAVGVAVHHYKLDYKLGVWLGEQIYKDAAASPLKKTVSPISNVIYTIDPSGYVYEGVTSNRLEGVKAVIYYEDYPADEFGQPDEDAGLRAIEWTEAEDYNEINPQYTDSQGEYGWDVPDGRWRILFSREGYEDYWTDWMEVPPEYTDVNVNLKNLASPAAETIHVYSDCVQIIFSQYMDIDSVTAGAVTVRMNGAGVSGTVEPVDVDYDYGENDPYARIFEFYPDETLSDEVTVEVSGALSYCGTEMTAVRKTSATAVKPEALTAAVSGSINYGSTDVMSLQVEPGEAAAYQIVEITAKTPAIADVERHKLVLDENGHAELTVFGKMPGTAVFEIAVRGTALRCTSEIIIADCLNEDRTPTNLSDCVVTLEYEEAVYTGEAMEPAVAVMDGETELVPGTDYTVVYSDHVNAGTAAVTITGSGSYTGTEIRHFVIHKADQTVRADISSASITVGETAQIIASGIGEIYYESGDTAVAAVNGSGVVTGIAAGTAVLSVIAAGDDNYNSGNAAVSVRVIEEPQEDVKFGSCGDDLAWALEEEGTLSISGKGPMYDYDIGEAPWYSYWKEIRAIRIGDGVTGIGRYAFSRAPLEGVREEDGHSVSVTVPASVATIGEYAFSENAGIKEIHFYGGMPDIAANAFEGITAAIYYPANDDSWDPDLLLQYGETLTWESWYPSGAYTDIDVCSVELSESSYTYDGSAKEPEVIVKNGSDTLVRDRDYTVVYSDHINAGTAAVFITGMGAYTGTISRIFSIARADLASCRAVLSADSYIYDGNSMEPEVTVTYGSYPLTAGKDYIVSYSGNLNAGTAAVTVTGAGNYTGTINRTFAIRKAVNKITVSKSEYSCDASAEKARTFSLGAAATGGTVSYSSDQGYVTADDRGTVTIAPNFAGTAVITITAGDNNYETVAKTVTVYVNQIDNVITASDFTKTASKKAQSFSIGAKCNGAGQLTYSSNSKSVTVKNSGKVKIAKNFVGKAQIKITAAASGIYKAADKTITITVNPANTKITGVKRISGQKMTVKWKKNASVSGYQIQYSTSRKFTKAAKVTIKKNAKTSAVISKLKAKKKYYVRIRTFRTVSGKKYYSSWSKIKTVPVKK